MSRRALLDRARRNNDYSTLAVDATGDLTLLMRRLFDEDWIKKERRHRTVMMTSRIARRNREMDRARVARVGTGC